jgi:hypothetical protein
MNIFSIENFELETYLNCYQCGYHSNRYEVTPIIILSFHFIILAMISGPSLVKYNTAVLVSTAGDKQKKAGKKQTDKTTTQTEVQTSNFYT